MNVKFDVQGSEISVIPINDKDYISLTDMLKAKDGDFFKRFPFYEKML